MAEAVTSTSYENITCAAAWKWTTNTCTNEEIGTISSNSSRVSYERITEWFKNFLQKGKNTLHCIAILLKLATGPQDIELPSKV